MKKFILKVGVTGTILIALLLLVNLTYINTSYYRNLNGMDKYRNVPEHLDIVNFGASHSQACYVWSSIPKDVSAFSMAYGGQTLVQDAHWLDYFIERIDGDTVVIIDVMFNSLYGNDIPAGQQYYQILPAEYISGWNIIDAIKYTYIPILGNRQDGIEAIEMRLFENREKNGNNFDSTVQSATQNVSDDIPTKVIDGWTLEEMTNEGKRRASAKMQEGPCGELGAQYDALRHMFEICHEKGCRIIVTTVPTTPYFYNGFKSEYLDRFYKDVNAVCEEYNVEYIDYTGDERFISDYRMWLDTDHMNGIGGEYFTKIFIEENNILH